MNNQPIFHEIVARFLNSSETAVLALLHDDKVLSAIGGKDKSVRLLENGDLVLSSGEDSFTMKSCESEGYRHVANYGNNDVFYHDELGVELQFSYGAFSVSSHLEKNRHRMALIRSSELLGARLDIEDIDKQLGLDGQLCDIKAS